VIEILVNEDLGTFEPKDDLEKLAVNVLKSLQPNLNSDLTVVITTDDEIRQLNAQYRATDRATDVLSFESDETDPESGVRYLGDIVISYPRALQQASDAGHSVHAELSLLLVHGILHLLGYDHDTPEAKAAMWKIQGQLLTGNGVHINKISGDEDDDE
jgi:probable rRNA maturation factor